MNIILGRPSEPEITEKYILLELDSFRLTEGGEQVPSFCVLENFAVNEMLQMQQYIDLHANLMNEYRKQNWSFCEQAIEHLMGRWQNQLDSFYTTLLERVNQLRDRQLDESWDGAINRF
jgi:hypothetical protein